MGSSSSKARCSGKFPDRGVAPKPAESPEALEVLAAEAKRSDPKTRRPDSFTEAEVRAALAKHKREPTPTAKALGISKTTLYELMDKHGIKLAKHYTLAEIQSAIDDRGGDDDLAAQDLFVSRRGLRARLKELKGG